MKLRIAQFLLLVFILFLPVQIFSDTIRVGYFNLEPHIYGENNNATGATVVYFKMLAEKMGDKVEWNGPYPLLRLTNLLKEGSLDVAINFVRLPLLEEYMYYTKNYVYLAKPVFIVKKNSKLTAVNTINDIKDFHIGVVKSTSGRYIPLIDDNRDKIDLQEQAAENWMELNLKKLMDNRLDAIFDRQEYTIAYIARKLGLQNDIKLIPAPAQATGVYVTISKKSPIAKALLERCDKYMPLVKYDYNALILDALNKMK